MSETWMAVVGYEGLYEVSDLGGVRSLYRQRLTTHGLQHWNGKILKPFVDPSNGYLYVNLSNGKHVKKSAVHRLVLSAFVGDPEKGQQACHWDGVRTHSTLSNLRWDSVSANAADRHRHGTATIGEKSPRAKLTNQQAREIIVRPESAKALADEYGVGASTVRAVRLGQNWRHIVSKQEIT